MKISIITVCRNASGTIRQTLDSVASQTDVPVEHIVIDGLSDDGTREIVEKVGDNVATFVSEKDNGLYDAINKGLEKATGDIVGLLHADDVYDDSRVLADVAQSFVNSGCDALYGDLVYVDREDIGKVRRYWRAGKYKDGAFLFGWMPPHPTFFIKRDTMLRYALYRSDFRFAGDYEYMLRLIHKHKIKLHYLPRTLVRMRLGGKSNSAVGNRLAANREDGMAWTVNGLRRNALTLVLKPLRKAGQFFARPK